MNIYYLLFNIIIAAKLIYADMKAECKIIKNFFGEDICCPQGEVNCNFKSNEHILEL